MLSFVGRFPGSPQVFAGDGAEKIATSPELMLIKETPGT
jgi:hypothetical protein